MMIAKCHFLHFCLLTIILISYIQTTRSQQQYYKVGTGIRPVIPTVGGRTDYVVEMPPWDCCSAGTFVEKFDVGQVAVGNGEPDCHWVRDVLNVRVGAIGPDPAGKTVVLVSAELYMLFRNDLQEYYDLMKEKLGEDVYSNIHFFVHAQHNHEGPDTSGLNVRPINHDYYRYMIEQMAEATIDALNNMQDAVLYHGSEQFYYGLGDRRDPKMQDSSLRIIRAYHANDPQKSRPPLMTLVNWGMHPEITLGYSPVVNQTNCSSLPIPRQNCTAKNSFFTHDYPGHLAQQLQLIQGGGGEVLYFNGAIGNQIGNWGEVWEPTPNAPVGNGSVIPPNAILVPQNFRNAYLIGRQMAEFAHNIADSAEAIPFGEFEYHEISFLSRVTNWAFRVGLCPQKALNPLGDPDRPLRIGNTMRKAYICSSASPVSADECTFDDYQYSYDEETKLPYRLGDWMETETKFIRIGNIKMISIPGELAPELSAGLPTNFDTEEGTAQYYSNPDLHATGANYVLPGVLMDMMKCASGSPCWVFGLTQDEVGYMFPISDWKIKCVQPTENCTLLHQLGALAYEDAASGEQCQQLISYPEIYVPYYQNSFGDDVLRQVNATCIYGQASGQVPDHYEETNAASWSSAEDYINAVARMLGVNPSGRYCETTCPDIGQVP